MKRIDADSQSTQYWIKKPKLSTGKEKGNDRYETPFSQLLGGKEPLDHVELRYRLLESTWRKQQVKIENILKHANVDLFKNLLQYVTNIESASQKLPIGFLQLGSNIANNLRIFKELEKYLLENETEKELKIVNLSSSTCANIKATIREIVKQVTSETEKKSGQDQYSNSDDSSQDEEDEEQEDGEEDDEDENEQANIDMVVNEGKKYHGKISYDFDIIADWCRDYYKRENSSFEKLRIVIVIQDSDALPNQLLNQVLRLVFSYSKSIPMRLIVGLSSINSNISTWLNNNLNNELRIFVEGHLYRTEDNKLLGHSICNDLFLQYHEDEDEFDTDDSNDHNILLPVLSPKLTATLLDRFENSNNSIDSLVSSFKLAYSTYFYQLPLPVLLSNKFNDKKFELYVDTLRKLPSFKKHIETILARISDLDLSSNKESIDSMKKEIIDLFEDSGAVKDLLSKSIKKSKFETFMTINATNLVYSLQMQDIQNGGLTFDGSKEKIEIYQLLTTRQIFSSLFLNNLLNFVGRLSAQGLIQQIRYINSLPKENSSGNDQDLILLIDELNIQLDVLQQQFERGTYKKYSEAASPNNKNIPETVRELLDKLSNKIITCYKKYFRKFTNESQLPFSEVFTVLGGTEVDPTQDELPERTSNLILRLLRPDLRYLLELALEDSTEYLSNSLIANDINSEEKYRISHPILTRLFHVYKDAPVSINIYDFFSAFRESFEKEKDCRILIKYLKENPTIEESSRLIDELTNIVDGKDKKHQIWDKIVYSWFLQGCFELHQMGIIKEKPKGDYLEKVIWKGV